MSGHTSDAIELLQTKSPKDVKRRRRRNKNAEHGGGLGYQSEGGVAALTRLVAQSCDDPSGSHLYLSDQGLPSERARIAASSRYRELQRSGREEEWSDERTPLLAAPVKESALTSSCGSGTPDMRYAGTGGTAAASPGNVYELALHMPGNDLRGGKSLRKGRVKLRREKW